MTKKITHPKANKPSSKKDNSLTETLYLLSSPANRKRLLSAIKDSEKERGVTFSSKEEINSFFNDLLIQET